MLSSSPNAALPGLYSDSLIDGDGEQPQQPVQLTSSRSNPLAQRLSGLLSTSYGDASLRQALEIVGSQLKENSPSQRRQIRPDAQARVLQNIHSTLLEFEPLAKTVENIGVNLNLVESNIAKIESELNQSSGELHSLLDEAKGLIAQQEALDLKTDLLKAFGSSFLLAPDDVRILTSLSTPIDEEFFDAFARTKEMYKNCQALLIGEPRQSGVEVMNQIGSALDGAYQKVLFFVKTELRSLTAEMIQFRLPVRRALTILAEQPELFHACLDFFSQIRSKALASDFQRALTVESDTSSSKPIELFAYDPIRYVGDMLAWILSATVGEEEILETLFMADAGQINHKLAEAYAEGPWLSVTQGELNIKAVMCSLVDRNINGAGRILKSRIEQAIVSQTDFTVCFALSNLLGFYRFTFKKFFTSESANFLLLLDQLREFSMVRFQRTVGDWLEDITVNIDDGSIGQDLQPPEFIVSGLRDLKKLMESYESSVTPPYQRQQGFRPVLSTVLDPLLSICLGDLAEFVYKAKSSAQEVSRLIFEINCLDAARSVLALYSFTLDKVTDLDKEIEERATRLSNLQYEQLLQVSGLSAQLDNLPLETQGGKVIWRNHQQEEAFRLHDLSKTTALISHEVPSVALEQELLLDKLSPTRLGSDILIRAKEKLLTEFDKVKHAGQVANIPEFDIHFSRTTDELRLLLTM